MPLPRALLYCDKKRSLLIHHFLVSRLFASSARAILLPFPHYPLLDEANKDWEIKVLTILLSYLISRRPLSSQRAVMATVALAMDSVSYHPHSCKVPQFVPDTYVIYNA